MLQAESIKLFLFVGSILLMFVLALLMVFCFIVGAEAVGQILLSTNVVMAITFSILAGFLGGSERKV